MIIDSLETFTLQQNHKETCEYVDKGEMSKEEYASLLRTVKYQNHQNSHGYLPPLKY